MKILKAVKSRPYDVCCTDNFEELKQSITTVCKPSSICIITDSHIAPIYLETVKSIVEQIAPTCVHVFEAGELSKNISVITPIFDTLLAHKIDRSSVIIALGGGVVGDIAGFAAATYMRGIPFIQIPTTVVAQNDSSIGGKVGVDYLKYKNIVGAFHNPLLVYINIRTLETLPARELIGGMSEVIKHALIYDAKLFEYLVAHKDQILALDKKIIKEMTFRSCKVKCDVVEADPKELGVRKILNFGHTVGHAIETLSAFKYSHGECVAYGIVVAAYMSYKRHLLDLKQVELIIEVCRKFGLLQSLDHYATADIWKHMAYDKKKSYGKVSFILLQDVAHTIIVTDVKEEDVEEAMKFLMKTCS
ncbi:3-dehydroquinate synthase [Cellulosilyticum sp. I15G10I2]|uniref:3-dehydroquinate synthase n=1 Tax=Cellulosilyticum sp. I15G10I2 TaxID=1892843 RepID=UPI00085BD576|nr:3-dehydroquinate synthase [Cellulosilyticum sp. I15G10I2]